jgi:hypothetical protein
VGRRFSPAIKPFLLAVALLAAAVALPTAATAASGAKLFYQDTIPKVGSAQVTVTARKAAAFRILLRTSTAGRTRLFLLGKHAPKGGPLIDTKTMHCDGAAGSFYCKGSYETLPAGTYTVRVTFVGIGLVPQPAHVELTVNW